MALPRPLLVAALLFATLRTASAQTQTQPVGMTIRAFTDPVRKNWQNTGPRPLNTVIWYPAAAGSPTAPFVATADKAKFFGDPSLAPDFAPIPVAYDAPLAPSAQKHPLILLSHGNTTLGISLMWFADLLAQHGYIVAAVNHHGNTIAEGQLLPQGFALPTERPADLSAVLTLLLADPVLGHQIDPNRIAAAGHSAGGATVIQLAGGIYDANAIIAYCNSPESQGDATCEPRDIIRQSIAHLAELRKTDPVVQESFRHLAESHRDPRIKAVFAMAPAIGPAFTRQDLSSIHIPVQIVVGDADDVAPPASNAIHYAKLIPGAKLTILPHVRHVTFGSDCTPQGREQLDSCRDTPGVDRAAIHQQVAEQALTFFQDAWKQK